MSRATRKPTEKPSNETAALDHAAHICVDMQNLFREATSPWRMPWMDRVLPNIQRIVQHRPSDTIFTRFIPAARPGEGAGAWSSYWTKWAELTLESLEPSQIELAPELATFSPPARVIDKSVYSPWGNPGLEAALSALGAETIIVTGGETDVCVLATVLGAIDRGYRVMVVTDALCSSTDATHDASLKLYADRYSEHIETLETEALLARWRR